MNDSVGAPADGDVLEALAVRCEAATAADRELDALIAGTQVRDISCTRFKTVQAWADEAIRERWNFARYTASLDAAMTLVPEGWNLSIDRIGAECGAVLNRTPFAQTAALANRCATPALALTAACLRARATPTGAEK